MPIDPSNVNTNEIINEIRIFRYLYRGAAIKYPIAPVAPSR